MILKACFAFIGVVEKQGFEKHSELSYLECGFGGVHDKVILLGLIQEPSYLECGFGVHDKAILLGLV